MDVDNEKERAHLIEAIADVDEEMERATEEGATIEDIEGAKTLADELIDRYEDLLKRLSADEQMTMRQRVGPVIEQVRGKLVQLKEAPE
jgi:F0F1-type ATP synthase membrane subunit b/b'